MEFAEQYFANYSGYLNTILSYKFGTKMKTKKIFLLVFAVLILSFCGKRTIPPQYSELSVPENLSLIRHNTEIFAVWNPAQNENIVSYLLYVGSEPDNYQDTIQVSGEKHTAKLPFGPLNEACYCRITAVNKFHEISTASAEASVPSYEKLEKFSQKSGTLDSSRWFYPPDYTNQISEGAVVTSEQEFFQSPMTRCFAQYLVLLPEDNFVVDCDFQLGTPNIGGAGVMIRSAKAVTANYYKGYFAYFFWDGENWYLHFEEGSRDRFALQNPKPIKLPLIAPEEWLQLSIAYSSGHIFVKAVRLSNFETLGTLSLQEKEWSRRPLPKDRYCGFFATQYGKNQIRLDNFAIARLRE